MKATLPTILFTLSTICAMGQITQQNLDYNNAAATVSNSGSFFNNASSATSGYEIPKGGGVHVMYSSQFWFGAKDVNGTLYTSLGGNSQGTDVDQGPYSNNGSYADPAYDEPYMISICQEEIDHFVLWWECQNGITSPGCATVDSPSSTTLNSVYNWPGNGLSSLGQSIMLAPFFDRNGDGIYDPVGAGDCPIIKGCCATYMIQNDAGNTHTLSGTDPVGLEMHYMFYQFGANSDLYNTTFVDVMAINKGGTNYTEFAYSFMADADIGYGQDDYFGSDSLTNTMIFYNSDNLDEGEYLANPPAIGVVALKEPSTSIMSYGSSPSTPAVAWNLLNGLQPNGVALQDPNGNPTTFLVHGDPNDPTVWNETSAGYIAGDRRGLNTSQQGAFNAGDTVLQTYAIVYSEGGDHLENASNVINLASWAKTFYDTEIDNGCDAGGIATTEELSSALISIYPNPSLGEFTISALDAQLKSIEIIDVTGKHIGFSKESFGSAWKVDLDSKTPGIYLVYIETELGFSTERIIVE